MQSCVDILLATYNGENYLREQLDSIVDQTYRDWRVIIRDDGSTDTTEAICEEYVELYPGRFEILREPVGQIGPAGSYASLMVYSVAPFVAFCDQDDIWRPDKLERQMAFIEKLQSSHGSLPILVHSDLEVVDEDGSQLSGSFWNYQHLAPARMQTLKRLLIQNCVTGCACVANRELVDIVLPVPDGAIMHDWWMALLAQSRGVLAYMNEPTLKYRQHAMNDTGAKKWNTEHIVRSMLIGSTLRHESLARTHVQARDLLEFGDLDRSSYDIVLRYVNLYDKGWLQRRMEILRGGYYKYGILRNLGVMFSL